MLEIFVSTTFVTQRCHQMYINEHKLHENKALGLTCQYLNDFKINKLCFYLYNDRAFYLNPGYSSAKEQMLFKYSIKNLIYSVFKYSVRRDTSFLEVVSERFVRGEVATVTGSSI